jgi:transcriptional regulator with XRE-family HTH domain
MRPAHILVAMAKGRAPRKRLTEEQWQEAIAAELRATLAARKIMQKDLSRALGVRDPSWISRRLSGEIPISAATLLVISDFMDEDIDAVLSRAKGRATNPCLSHNDTTIPPRNPNPGAPPAAPTAIRVA